MSRLPRPSPASLDPDQLTLYREIAQGRRAAVPQLFALTDPEGGLNGPFNAMLLSPPVGAALQALGSALRHSTSLSPRVREMAVLAVASAWDSAFERYAHEPLAGAAGLSHQEIAALSSGVDPGFVDPPEAAAFQLVTVLLAGGNLDDPTYSDTVNALGTREVFELSTLVGYYSTLALQPRVFAVGAPD
ncbi:MAG: carboxymuconolactone decarboxylase [Frankiales bacterium]|nr:carboxymuconolactone decarboxylase [Frankiales bacterium]